MVQSRPQTVVLAVDVRKKLVKNTVWSYVMVPNTVSNTISMNICLSDISNKNLLAYNCK